MKLKVAIVVGVILAVIVGFVLVWSKNKQSVRMNNQTCPVSGSPVNGNDTYTHEGKEYNLCSDKCKQPLAEEPGKYLSK